MTSTGCQTRGFPVERVSIVGGGLRSIEKVLGRVTTARAALAGAAQGATIGVLLGALFGLFFTTVAGFFALVLYGLVAGALWGSLWGAIVHYAQRGRREFGSVIETRADRYEVQVDDAVAGEAERVLERMRPTVA